MLSRRLNHCPIIVRLVMESALCPKPRVSVSNTNNIVTLAVALIASTTPPSMNANAVNTTRLPS